MDVRARVETAAASFAARAGCSDIASIPAHLRQKAIDAAAAAGGVSSATAQLYLSIHWNETSGKQGTALTGASIAMVSSNRSRGVDNAAHQVRIANQAVEQRSSQPPAGEVVLKRSDQILAALGEDSLVKISHRAAIDHAPKILRRGIALDAQVIQPGLYDAPDRKPRTGEYGLVRLAKVPANDPILDTPIYRGMSSADPGIHALKLTGKLIPPGTSYDYEAFKTYSNREPLDAYEWSLDPYVALSRSGGHGYLLQTTLRELLEQGLKDVTRKVGDTEGGIFIPASIKPRARIVGHLGEAFELGRFLPPAAHEKADVYAKILARKVPEAGGWEDFIASGEKAAFPLIAARAEETGAQILFFARRLEQLEPGNALIDQARTALREQDPRDFAGRAEAGKKIVDRLKVRIADLEEAKG